MTSRIRILLQKCIYWTDAALQTSIHNYYKTVEWKRAVQYARQAKQLLTAMQISKELWSDLEQRILDRGYPVLSQRALYDSIDSDFNMTDIGNYKLKQHFIDPIEDLQSKLIDEQQQTKQWKIKCSDWERKLDDLNVKLKTQYESTVKTLQEQYSQLQQKHETVQDDLETITRKYSLYVTHVKEKLDECYATQHASRLLNEEHQASKQLCEELQNQVNHFKYISEKAVSLLTDNQREELQQFLGTT
jgi:chromosome segregation ATPase